MGEFAAALWQTGALCRGGDMIFVTVGMHHQGFERLIRAMDEVAAQISEEVIMQIGSSTYEPQRAQTWFRFAEQKVVDTYCAESRVIVGHAGAGTVIGARRAQRPLVISPRLASQNEAINDFPLARRITPARTRWPIKCRR